MTRVQRERFTDAIEYERVKNIYSLNAAMLQGAKPNMKILHPLPRVNEIALDVDNTKHAYYFDQARNGVFTRMAIIAKLMGKI
jgi:aspartate carbamoyltransferase catalytic subunit